MTRNRRRPAASTRRDGGFRLMPHPPLLTFTNPYCTQRSSRPVPAPALVVKPRRGRSSLIGALRCSCWCVAAFWKWCSVTLRSLTYLEIKREFCSHLLPAPISPTSRQSLSEALTCYVLGALDNVESSNKYSCIQMDERVDTQTDTCARDMGGGEAFRRTSRTPSFAILKWCPTTEHNGRFVRM